MRRKYRQILVCLSRQTHHEIELDVIPAALKAISQACSVLLADVLIDNITQRCVPASHANVRPLFTGFCTLHQFGGKAVRTKRRQRQADMPRLTIVEHALGQDRQLTVVTGETARTEISS